MKNKPEKKMQKSKVSWFLYLARFLTYIPLLIFFPVKIIGNKKLPKGKLVLAMNHKSGWDPIVIVQRFRPPIHFVAKTEFSANKFLGWLMSLTGCVFIKRGEADVSATRRIVDILKREHALGLFPEGTRHPENDGKIAPLKTGAVYYALKEKAPIVPFVIDKKLKAFSPNTLMVGEAFELTEFYDKPITAEVLSEATQILYKKMLELREKLNSGSFVKK